ncbi:hypothetical protein [uncultured Jannaschia sp.]|uniref:hypothetical protein n=1 Tax=uncultured Jannaschia sp. TaxID=293347 RepID=UPI00262D1824|nr:hypothetical protein [uncultured Jannaschia sp.]
MSAKRKSDDAMEELERLLDRELSALLSRHKPGRSRNEWGGRDTDANAPHDESMPDNVVRAHPVARRTIRSTTKISSKDLFTPEEEAFIKNAVDWLQRRENSDILLDELTRRLAPGDEESETWTEERRGYSANDDDWDGTFDLEEGDQSEVDDNDWGDGDTTAPDPDPDSAPDTA